MRTTRTWDIFCRVVDNFGDIGVCWRLARQLAAEHGQRVRLWVDDLSAFARIQAGVVPALARQVVRGVEVLVWTAPFQANLVTEPADIVLEAFACDVPEAYVQAMARRVPSPVWINLEYLSAEDWVAGCHALPSPHPRLPLVKYFFFPGFSAGTGGLLRERGLLEQRRRFCRSVRAQGLLWESLGLSMPAADEVRVSLFAYPDPALPELLAAWADSPGRVVCLVPDGPVAAEACCLAGADAIRPGTTALWGNLEVRVFPFLPQDRYDRLLWACDCNFVRGEDSFVRAQWAGRPFAWHIYPQEEGAHWPKLLAFLDLYCAGLSLEAGDALRGLWQAWNRGKGIGPAWKTFWENRCALAAHGETWALALASRKHLADALVEFCEDRIKCPAIPILH